MGAIAQVRSFFFLRSSLCGFYCPVDVAHFQQCHFNMQALVARHFEIDIAVVGDIQGREQERGRRQCRLFAVALTQALARFEQGQGGLVFANQDVAQVLGQSAQEHFGFEAFAQNLVKQIE